MKILRKASALEVKRAFVVSDLVRRPEKGQRYLPLLSADDFAARLAAAKKRVKKLSAKALDRAIGYKPRRAAYNACTWYLATVSTREIAIWKGAGGLPRAWTKGSLAETGGHVRRALAHGGKGLAARSRRAIPRIIATSKSAIATDLYLLPIILPGGTLPNARRGVKVFKGDIDDGSMRSVALAASGAKTIKAWVGKE